MTTDSIPLRILRLAVLCFSAALLSVNTRVSAQEAGGTLAGTVIDTKTGKYLEGADVSIEGTSLTTTSARSGAFELRNVPLGAQKLLVTYPGLDPVTLPVAITAGQTTSVPVRLGEVSDVMQLSAFKVAGTKEGMAQAIALQKASINAKIVAAGDQYGDIAEGNAAEYLKFLPGVGVDYNANDARAVTLRGMSTAFTNVTLNGSPIASATSGNLNRRFEFEQVAINNVETVEVIKTLTPEIPAISTGGLVNLVTKSALDRQGDQFSYRTYLQATDTVLTFDKTEGYGQELTRKIVPGIDLNYAKHLGANLGVNLSYKNSTLINDYPRSTYAWEYNPTNGGIPTAPALTSWNLQNEQKTTRRQSFSVQLDWKVNEHTKLSATGMWNYYDLLFTDRTTTVNTGTLAGLATTSTPAYGNGTVVGRAGAGSATFATINRSKSGTTYVSHLGLTHDFPNNATFDAATSWSQSYSKYRDTNGSWFADTTVQRGGTNPATGTVTDPLTVTFTGVGGVAPRYTIVDAAGAAVDLRDLSKFTATTISSRPQTGVDTRNGYSADYKLPLNLAVPASVKVGARFDTTTRNLDNRIFRRTGNTAALGFGGASAITGAQLAATADQNFSQHPIGYGLPAYNFVNLYTAYTLLGGTALLPHLPASDTLARFDDSTKAGYVRFDITPLKDLLIVGGVRYEDQQTDSQNRLSTLPAIIRSKFATKKWFPSINLKYTPNKNFVLRAAASKSIGLPDYVDLLPGPTTLTAPDLSTSTRGTASIYNPNLKAYGVTSYDVGVEYYFSRSSVVSVSVFRKDFTNYIITAKQALSADLAANLGLPAASIVGPADQYDVTYKFNVPETGHYNGLELSYAQNFSFLPKPFNTLSLQANATVLSIDPIDSKAVFSSTDANLSTTIRQQINKGMELAAVKQAFNVTLSYSIGKFGFTVTSNYTGHVLKSVVQKTVKYTDVAVANQTYFNELQYQAPRELVDFRMDYKWNRKFTPYFQARNIFARPIVMSTPTNPFNHSEYGDPIYELGVRGVW